MAEKHASSTGQSSVIVVGSHAVTPHFAACRDMSRSSATLPFEASMPMKP